MVHEARKVVTAIMGNCTRRMVPQWRISLPLTTDCPNTSCSPRQHNERPLSGSGSLYITDVLFISIAWTMVLSSISLPPFSPLCFTSPLFSPALTFPRFEFILSTLLPCPPRAVAFLLRAANQQPLDKPSDLYEDYVDLLLESIASEGTTGSSVETSGKSGTLGISSDDPSAQVHRVYA